MKHADESATVLRLDTKMSRPSLAFQLSCWLANHVGGILVAEERGHLHPGSSLSYAVIGTTIT